MIERDKFSAVLSRCLNEITWAKYNRQVLVEMENYKIDYGYEIGFFWLANKALYHDMLARVVKVLDKNEHSSTFWYIRNHYASQVDSILEQQGMPVEELRTFYIKRLRNIRNKTLFHIDKKGVINPDQIWHEAAINGRELESVINAVSAALFEVHLIKYNQPWPHMSYDGKDIGKVIRVAVNNSLLQYET